MFAHYFDVFPSAQDIGFVVPTYVAIALACGVYLYKRHKRISELSKKLDPVRKKIPQQDLPPVFPNGWFPVLESSQVKAGQVQRIDVLGLELVAFRTSSGELHVVDAYCPHLGAHLGVMGRVVGECIECPFHGWRFNGADGACTHVPYAAKVPEFVKIKTWEIEEVNGFVFLWYHAEGDEPSWRILDIPEISTGSWKLWKRYEDRVSVHIRDITENESDMAHFYYFHKPNPLVSAEEFSVNGGATPWGRMLKHVWSAEWSIKEHVCCLDVDGVVHIFDRHYKLFDHKAKIRLYGPGFMSVTVDTNFGKAIALAAIVPEGPFQIRVVSRIHFAPNTSFITRIISSHIFYAAFQRDLLVWNHKKMFKNPPLQKVDRHIAGFRKWYTQFYTEHSPTWQDIRDRSLEW